MSKDDRSEAIKAFDPFRDRLAALLGAEFAFHSAFAKMVRMKAEGETPEAAIDAVMKTLVSAAAK